MHSLDGPHIQNLVGVWSMKSGLSIDQLNIFERRKDLFGAVLTNSVLQFRPYCFVNELKDGTLAVSGFYASLLNYVQRVSGTTH